MFKPLLRSVLILAVLFAAAHTGAQPLSTTFTFQGDLRNGPSPAAGTYDFRFTLHDALAAGAQVGPQLCSDNVTVAGGKVTVQLDFGAQFAGQQRFLEVQVRADTGLSCANATGFTTLSPRQSLTAAPNAVHSMNAGTATTAATATSATTATTAANATQLGGQPATFYTNAANLTGLLPNAALSGAYANVLTFSNASNSFTGNGAGLINLSAASIASGTLAPARGGTGANTSGASLNQVLKWNGAAWTPGTDSDTLYSAGAGLNLSGTTLSIQPNGVTSSMLASDTSSLNRVSGGAMYTDGFFVGIGTTAPIGSAQLVLSQDTTAYGGMYVNTSSFTGWPFYGYAQGGGFVAWHYIDGSDDNKWKLINDNACRLTVTRTGDVGIGNQYPGARLHISADSSGPGDHTALFDAPNIGPNASAIHSGAAGDWYIRSASSAGRVVIQDTGGFVGIGTAAPSATLDIAGTARGTANINGFALDITNSNTAAGSLNGGIRGTTAGGTSAKGVYGKASSSTGTTYGVYAESASVDGIALAAAATSTTGFNRGGLFSTTSPQGIALHAESTATGNVAPTGVFARVAAGQGWALWGHATAQFGSGGGVLGWTDGQSSDAIRGWNWYPSGGVIGVHGGTASPNGYGVLSTGSFGASGLKSFRIDHPANPENKYLLHYCAEGPQPQNVYNGIATLNEQGEVEIILPSYFAAINKDPRYALSALDAPMPMLHIARRISSADLQAGAAVAPGQPIPACSFRISGGAPNGEVSWEVKATRNDRWAQQHGAPVEVDKPEHEKGTYQHPDLYNQPPQRGTYYDAMRTRASDAAILDAPP